MDRCLLARGLSGFVLRMTKTCVRGRWRQTNTDIDKKMTDGKRERDTDRLAKRQRDEVTYASGLRVLKIHVVQQEKTKQNKTKKPAAKFCASLNGAYSGGGSGGRAGVGVERECQPRQQIP